MGSKIAIADRDSQIKMMKAELTKLEDKRISTSESSGMLGAKLASLESERDHFSHSLEAEKRRMTACPDEVPEARVVDIIEMVVEQSKIRHQAIAELRVSLMNGHREISEAYEQRIYEHKDSIGEWETVWWGAEH